MLSLALVFVMFGCSDSGTEPVKDTDLLKYSDDPSITFNICVEPFLRTEISLEPYYVNMFKYTLQNYDAQAPWYKYKYIDTLLQGAAVNANGAMFLNIIEREITPNYTMNYYAVYPSLYCRKDTLNNNYTSLYYGVLFKQIIPIKEGWRGNRSIPTYEELVSVYDDIIYVEINQDFDDCLPYKFTIFPKIKDISDEIIKNRAFFEILLKNISMNIVSHTDIDKADMIEIILMNVFIHSEFKSNCVHDWKSQIDEYYFDKY